MSLSAPRCKFRPKFFKLISMDFISFGKSHSDKFKGPKFLWWLSLSAPRCKFRPKFFKLISMDFISFGKSHSDKFKGPKFLWWLSLCADIIKMIDTHYNNNCLHLLLTAKKYHRHKAHHNLKHP